MKCIWLISCCISIFPIITLYKTCERHSELFGGFNSFFSQKTSCNDTESNQFISFLSSERLDRQIQKNDVIVISASPNDIFKLLINNLRNKYFKVEFLLVPSESKKGEIGLIPKKLLLLNPKNFAPCVIIAETIDRIGEIFQDFTNVFGDLSKFNFAIHFGVLLDHKENISKVVKKLEDVGRKSNRTDIMKLLQYIRKHPDDYIYMFKNVEPSQIYAINLGTIIKVQLRLKHYKSKSSTELVDFKSLLTQHFQDLITCSIPIVNRTILSKMKNFASKVASHFSDELDKTDDISEQEHAGKVAKNFNYLWQGSRGLPSMKSATDFLQRMRQLVNHFSFTDKDEELYLLQNMKVFQFLSTRTSDLNAFSTTATAWSQPFQEFRINNSKLTQWYEVVENGLLYPRNFDNFTICTEIREGQKLQVKANLIWLSDVKLNKCSGDVKLIELLAAEKVFIDLDLNRVGKMLQVVIIAPTWEINGNRKFNLNGEDGKEPVEKIAKNGSSPGNKNGAHGVAGLPGGPAGSFYGMANTIINGGNLTILANGGKGGPGQDGGHGANESEVGESYKGVPSFNCKNQTVPGWSSIFCEQRTVVVNSRENIKYLMSYKVFGKAGKRGGRGGNGGVGGTGGKGGNIIVQELLKHDLGIDPVTSAENGEKGSGGFGGNGGLGGKNGNPADVECSEYTFEVDGIYEMHKFTGFGERGLLGKLNTSLKMRETPKNPVIVQSFPSSINEYKLFARMQLAQFDLGQRNILSKFYDSLNTQEEVAKWYDTLSLVEEFMGLEMQYLDLHKRVNLTSSYQALRKRIQNYAENPYKKNENNENYREVLKDLHRDITKKIDNIYRGKEEYPVSTNIKSKLEILATKLIKKMEDSVTIDRILFLLDEEKQSLDNMIEEAQYMITKEIQPVMNDLNATLDDEISALLIENSELKKKANDKMGELAENRKQLEHNILLKGVCGILKVGCGVLGMINPALGLAGDLASSALSVVETESTSSGNKISGISIPDAVKDAAAATIKFLEDKKKQEITKKISGVVEAGSKTISSIMNDQNKIEEVDKALQQTQEDLRKLDQYEEQIYNVTEPMLKNMMETLGLASKEMSSMDKNQLLLTNWKVTETIMNVQHIIQNMTKGFSVTEDITWSLDKLIRAFKFMIKMHAEVLKYQSKIKEQKFITELHIALRGYLLTSESRLSSALARLQVFLSYNSVSDSYGKCILAFKQFAFPYAGIVLKNFRLPDIFASRKLSDSISDIEQNVMNLQNSLDPDERLYELLQNFQYQKFTGSLNSRKAFYTWSSEKYKKEIQNILGGKKTELVANITKESFNALKFKQVGVVFTCKNHKILDTLNSALENFEVDLTHHGDSVYKCGNGIYEIRNTPTTLSYSFMKNSIDEPDNTNEIYQKITKGEFMLSPFATWSVQLFSNDENFKMLEQFKDKVDLELIGYGQYLRDRDVECENNMENYYTKIGSFN